MRLSRRAKGVAIAGAGIVALGLVSARPAAALFGLEDFAMIAKLIAIENQLVHIYSVNTNTYNQAKAMVQRFTHFDRQFWLTQGINRVDDYTRNQFGETIAWHATMGGSPGYASQAWNSSVLTLKGNPRTPLNETAKAALASAEVIDGTATRCLQVIAQYRKNADQNVQHIQALQASLDGASSTMQQLELTNAANAQAANESRAQGEIQACLAEQQAEAGKVTRDQIVEALNFAAQTRALASTTNAAMGGISQVANKSWMQ